MRSFVFIAVLATFAASVTQAAIVTNGNFEAGNWGFSSGYTYVADVAGIYPDQSAGLGMWAEGTYTVWTNPKDAHNLWASFGDHTTGTGKMMLVNGDPTAGTKVWSETLPLVAGQSYTFSAWAASVYSDNPATLRFSVGGVDLGDLTLGNVSGIWQEFTKTFTATSSTTATAVDLIVERSGNDFALDDISVATPEPATIIIWSLLGGLGLVFAWRKRKTA